jgi:hypothetical protein
MDDLSQPFTDMAARINLNAEQGFGGAFVIVPPGDEPKPRVMLMLDNSENPAMFWSNLQTTAQIALQELQNEEQQQAGGFMGMRR